MLHLSVTSVAVIFSSVMASPILLFFCGTVQCLGNRAHSAPLQIGRTISEKQPSTFVLRGDDMKFRAKVTLEYKSPNYVLDTHNPWTMTFHNIRNGEGEKAIELVHPGTNGKEYVWINPGRWITHSVASGSKFALREDGVDPRDTMATMIFVLTDPTDEL